MYALLRIFTWLLVLTALVFGTMYGLDYFIDPVQNETTKVFIVRPSS